MKFRIYILTIVLISYSLVFADNKDNSKIYLPADNCNLAGFTTYTPGGWGAPANGNNPGTIRDNYFSLVYPSGMTVGANTGFKMVFTSAAAIEDYLPAGGTGGALTQNYLNPTSTSAGVLGGHLTSMKLAMDFDAAGYIGTNTTYLLKDLVITKGPFIGKTVQEFYDIAVNGLSGNSVPYTFSQLVDAATAFNENFDNGTVNKGFLTCPTTPQLASLGNYVWLDSNKNGLQDTDENGVSGITVKLYDCNDVLKATTTTDVNGQYLFLNLTPGNYYVKFEIGANYNFTLKDQGTNDNIDSDADVTTGKTTCTQLVAGENDLSWDAGIYLKPASLGDKVWLDVNKNGIQESGENGVGGIIVKLYDCSNNFISQTNTDANGNYLFSNLTPGQYYVKFEIPSGYLPTTKDVGTNDAIDSDINASGVTVCTELSPGENDLTWDAGIYQDIQKITPILECVEDLGNNTYKAYFGYNNPNSFNVIIPVGTDNKFTPLPEDRGQTTTFLPGRNYKTFSVIFDGNNLVWTLNTKTATASKFSKNCKASIGDKVWLDANQNGVQESGENGVANVVVKLYDCNNNFIAETTTNANGEYLFDNLNPGSYKIKFILPNGYVFTSKDQGTDNSDSDADLITGETICTTLEEGENDMTWDAGIYQQGSTNDCVINWTGTLGNDEARCLYEPQWITITGSVTLTPNPSIAKLQTSWRVVHPTSINNCPTGYAPCTDEHYTTVDITGSTTFTITAWWPGISSLDEIVEIHFGANVLDCNGNPIHNGIGKDIYWYPWVCPPPEGPKPKVSKDDGLLIMPDIGQSTTYTITYKNEGTVDLLNAKIEDVLPAGTSFVSATNGGTYSNTTNKVTWNLGTLSALATGTVQLTVKNEEEKADYTNTVCLIGFDNSNKQYSNCAEDINVYDTTSGGGGAGVESNSDLAELLLKRSILIKNKMTTPVKSFFKQTFSPSLNLKDIIPYTGPYSSFSVETTPFDIAAVSNATSSYAYDYLMNYKNGTRRIAGIFATTTNPPNIYDHTKQVCDRLNEYELNDVKFAFIDGNEFYVAKLANSKLKTSDNSISFSVYETPEGYYVESKWSYKEYKVPSTATAVYNFQVWSSTVSGASDLVKKILNKFKLSKNVYHINDFQFRPSVFISKGAYLHDGKVNMRLINTSDVQQNIKLTYQYKYSQGGNLNISNQNLSLQPGINDYILPTGIIQDAKLFVQAQNGFTDELFVSGGSLAYFSSQNTSVTSFVTNNYPAYSLADFPEGSQVLAGGFRITGVLGDYVNVFRSVKGNTTEYSFKGADKLRFTANGKGRLNIFIEQSDTKDYNYFKKAIDLTGYEKSYEINISDFKLRNGNNGTVDLTKITHLAFSYEKGDNISAKDFDIEVKGIAFTKKNGTDPNSEIPQSFVLKQNYPNPFNPGTVIEYYVGTSSNVTLKVYDVLGKEIAVLVDGFVNQGTHYANWKPENVVSGIYMYELVSGATRLSKKMLYLR